MIVVTEDFTEIFEGLNLDQRLALYVTKWPEGVKVYRSGREKCLNTTQGRAEYARRRKFIWQAYGEVCRLCGRHLDLDCCSNDHKTPRGAGGGFRDDRVGNLMPACLRCNGYRGSRRLGEGPCRECGYEIVLVDECLRCGGRW